MATETPRQGVSELRVRSVPDDADVTINNRYVGRTPLTVDDLSPGTHRVVISRSGYRTVERWIRLRDNSISELEVALEQRVGFLAVSVQPDGAELFLDGSRFADTGNRFPVGEYTLTATAFGYQTDVRRVTIRENRTTSIVIALQPAPFALSAVAITNARFNPANPGPRGSVMIRFSASAPGSAEVTIQDASDVRFTHEIKTLTAENRVWWNGRDQSGKPLPDGLYTVIVRAVSVDGESIIQSTETVRIDSALRIGYRSMSGGVAGAQFSPDTVTLPVSSYQISAGSLGRWRVDPEAVFDRASAHLGIRVGAGEKLEPSLAAEVAVSTERPETHLQATLSLRWAYADPPPGAGVRFTGAAQTVLTLASGPGTEPIPRDTTANHPRWAIAAPVGVVTGPIRVIFAPEIAVSDSHPAARGAAVSGRFPLVWGYGRAAVIYDSGPTVAAVSTALRTEPWLRDVTGPLSVAVEYHRLIPNTPLFLSFVTAAEIERSGAIMVGLGLGVLP
ncbi:MAG: PEGA domain-containing protein [Spirochaetaceae bacterium]|nr:MAG: PEGA domain-containing protein [Spirochaetaceae bacterium]